MILERLVNPVEEEFLFLDSRTEKFGNHQQYDVIPELNGSWNVSLASFRRSPRPLV